MKFKLDEQEIGISINAADTTAMITITGYPAYLRKFKKLSDAFPEDYKLLKEHFDAGEVYARQYLVTKKYIKFGKPPTEARKEQGRKAAEYLKVNKGAQAKVDSKY